MLCTYRSPDAESVRFVLRQQGLDAGTVQRMEVTGPYHAEHRHDEKTVFDCLRSLGVPVDAVWPCREFDPNPQALFQAPADVQSGDEV